MVPSFLASGENGCPAKGAKSLLRTGDLFIHGGGMSQIDTLTLKTLRKSEVLSRPIATQSADLQLSDKLPKLAMQGNDLSVVRSMTTKTGAYPGARYWHIGLAKEPASLIRNSDHGPKCFW